MIQKKICMLGAFAVGKTSLVARFVHSMFSEKYHTTLGVKIDKKVLSVDQKEVTLVLWDIAGEDEFQKVQTSYLRGSSGYILVVDGTRSETLDRAMMLREKVEKDIAVLPFILLLNKADLENEWTVAPAALDELAKSGVPLYRTSAKTGQNVEEAFVTLTRRMME